MECGKLTAKLRDMVTVRFYEDEIELKRYHNIELPDEIKAMPFKGYEFCVPLDGAITFKIWLEENPAEWPEPRARKARKTKATPIEQEKIEVAEEQATELATDEKPDDREHEELRVKYQGDRKTLVAAISTILETPSKYLALPTYAFQIGDYQVERDGTLVGPMNSELLAKLSDMGFVAE